MSAVWTVEPLIHAASPEVQTSTVDPRTQTRALISSPTPASLRGLRFPLHPSIRPPCFQPPLQASLLPSPHQLHPFPLSAGPSPPSVTPGVTESGRSEVVLPTATPDIATPGISQKQPCRATPTRPSTSQRRQGSPRCRQQWTGPVALLWLDNCLILRLFIVFWVVSSTDPPLLQLYNFICMFSSLKKESS